MKTGNYFVDMGFQEQLSTPAEPFASAPYLADIQNTNNLPQSPTEAKPQYEEFGLNNQEEFDLMQAVKDQGGSADDFTFILEDYRGKTEPTIPAIEEAPEEKNILQNIGGALKVESKFDTTSQEALDGNIFKNNLKRLANNSRAVLNVPGDAIELAGDIGELIANPIDTAKGIYGLAGAITGKLGFTEDNEEKEAIRGAIVSELEKNFGTTETALETITQNPFDALSSVFGGVGAAKTVLSKTGASAGTLNKLQKLQDISNPINALKTELSVGKEALGVVGKPISVGVGKLTDSILDSTLQLKPSDIGKIKKAIPDSTPSKWLLENNIIDDASAAQGREGIVAKLQDFNTSSYDKLNESVAKSKGLFKDSNADKALASMVNQLDDVPGLEEKLGRLKSLQAKAKGEGLTLTEQLETKRLIDNTLDLYKVTGDPKVGAAKEGLINIRKGLREAIEKEALDQGLGDVAKLSNDIRTSRLIKDSLVNRIDTVTKNSLLSLSDVIVGGAGFAGADLGVGLALLAGKKIASSPAFKLYAVKTLQLPSKITSKIGTTAKFTQKETLAVSNAIAQYVKTEGKNAFNDITDDIGRLAGDKVDDISTKLGAKSNFVDDTIGSGKSLDDFKEVSPTVSSDGVDLSRLKGDQRLEAQDVLDEIIGVGAEVDNKGFVTLYHHTTPQAKKAIEESGKMFGKEKGIFFTTKKNGQAEGFGESVVKVRIPVERLELDDIFGNEAHMQVMTNKIGNNIEVEIIR